MSELLFERVLMKVTVYHSYYSCESGCCGHVVELEDGRKRFDFVHPYGQDPKEFAKELIIAAFGEEHIKDLDWDNCSVSED